MKCKEIEKELIAYYYKETEPSMDAEISKHLEDCEMCATSWRKLKMTLNAVEVKELEMPGAFWNKYLGRVYWKIKNRKAQKRFFTSRLVPVTAGVLTLLLVVFGGLRLYESRQEDAFISSNYEILRGLDVYQNLEVLQHLEEIEAMHRA